MWKDHQYYTFLWPQNESSGGISLPELLPELHVIPDQDISFSFSETSHVNWGEESPTSGTEFNIMYIDKSILQHVRDFAACVFTVTLQDLCFELI